MGTTLRAAGGEEVGGVAVVERPQCRDSGQSRIVFSLGGPHLSEVLGASRLDVEAFEVFLPIMNSWSHQ